MKQPTKPERNGNGNQQLAVQEPSVLAMLQTVIEKGVTAESVAVLDSLANLHDRMKAKEAEREFAKAFNALMAEIPIIQATHIVPNKQGGVKYRLAKLEEIDAQLRPLAQKHGFTYWFEEGQSDNGRVAKTCVVQHVGGHKRSNSFTVRIGAGPPDTSDSQKDMSAHKFAKRGCLCDAFAIMIEEAVSDDARMIGKPIGKALAEDLYLRVKKCGADEQAFLKFAGVACSNPAKAEDYEQIPDDRYDALDAMLKRKEGRLI